MNVTGSLFIDLYHLVFHESKHCWLQLSLSVSVEWNTCFSPPSLSGTCFSFSTNFLHFLVEDEPTWVAKKVFFLHEMIIAITCSPMSRDETDKEGELVALDYDTDTSKGERAVKVATTNVFSIQPLSFNNYKKKVILLGDSAVGKSKLVERFLLDGFAPQQLSTYALTLYRWNIKKMSNGCLSVIQGTGQKWELETC